MRTRVERQVEQIISPDYYTRFAPSLGPLATSILSIIARYGDISNHQAILDIDWVARELGTTQLNALVAITALVEAQIIGVNRNPITLVAKIRDRSDWVESGKEIV